MALKYLDENALAYIFQKMKGISGSSDVSIKTEPIDGGHRITITDGDGPESFDVMDGPAGPQGVSGVYVGPGEMPEGYNVQIVPDADPTPLPVGPQGPQGEVGPTGPKGETGPQGERGPAFVYEDFTPAQLEALRGPRGETGPAGPQGDRGQTGQTGSQGPRGETGPQGEVGPQGPKPVKGVDYWTAADKSEIVEQVRADLQIQAFRVDNVEPDDSVGADGDLYLKLGV